MKHLIIGAASVLVSVAAFASATIENVIVRQQWPWNGKVNIDYVLRDPTGGRHDINVECKDGNTAVTNAWGSLSGDLIGVASGAHRIVWDPTVGGSTGGKTVYADFTAALSVADEDDLYMVIDVSNGSVSETFPITFVNTEPEGGWNQDEYKTSKIVLRRIPAGTFMMGSPEDEIGRNEAREKLHLTTISRSFYMGVFEMTQKQYENITGTAVTDDSFKGDKRPANKVSYDDLRGVGAAVYGAETADWPNYHEGGFFDSFNKKVTLPEKLSGYVFDLPSAAQWEYACRAGTLGAWNDGTTITNESTDDNLGRIGYYRGNAGFRLHDVGEKDVANAFGLYDMHGNVLEFVIDYVNGGTGAVFFDGSPVVDPILYSPTKWPQTVGKGGNYGRNPFECRSAIFVNAGAVSDQSQAQGFRLALYHR